MIESNVRSHSTFRSILAAIAAFAVGAVVQPAAAVVINETTVSIPSLAAFNGKLYISGEIYLSSSTDGVSWSQAQLGPDNATSNYTPALAV